MSDTTYRVLYFVTIVIAAVLLYRMGVEYQDCKHIGGQYVRGMFWMECIPNQFDYIEP